MSTSSLSRREFLKVAGGVGLAGLSATSGIQSLTARASAAQRAVANSPYSQNVISLGPVGYWRLGERFGPTALDWSGNESTGVYHGSPAFGEIGAIQHDANTAIGLNGESYVEIPSRAAFSIGAAGLTVQAWVRPDRLDFPCQASTEYIHWLGKGEAGTVEWGFRFYKKDSSRPNRISAYAWNPDGKLGSGAYFQEPVTPGQWIQVVAVYQPPGINSGVQIYRNGVLKSGPPSPPTLYRSYRVTPRPGGSPLRLGSRDLKSFLIGGLDEVAIYPRCLTPAEIKRSYQIALR